MSEGERERSEDRSKATGLWPERACLCWLWRWRNGLEFQERGQPLETAKGRKRVPPRVSEKERSPANWFCPVRHHFGFLTSRTVKITNLCSFKALNLWQYVTAAKGNCYKTPQYWKNRWQTNITCLILNKGLSLCLRNNYQALSTTIGENILQNTWLVPLKTVKIIRNKENLGNCHSQEEPKETRQWIVTWSPWWDPGTDEDDVKTKGNK